MQDEQTKHVQRGRALFVGLAFKDEEVGLSREPQESGEILIAEMAVGYGALRERYTSRVTINPAARCIDVVEIKGPFQQLENHWRFTPKEHGCEVEFSIAFQFANRLLSAAADAAFGKIVLKMADAFEARAKALSYRAA